MPWIEGIGDEVTLTVGVLLVLIILLAAWISTGTRDLPFFSVIIVQLRRRSPQQADSRNHDTENSSQSHATENQPELENGASSHAENSVDSVNDKSTNNHPSASNITRSGSDELELESLNTVECSTLNTDVTLENTNAVIESDHLTERNANEDSDNESDRGSNSASDCESLTPSELRKRRLDFLSGKHITHSKEGDDDTHEFVKAAANTSQQVSERSATHSTQENIKVPVTHSPPVDASNSSVTPDTASKSKESASSSSLGSHENEQENRDVPDHGTDTELGAESRTSGNFPREIRVKIMFLNETFKMVTSPATETIGNFRRKHFSSELEQSKLVRFIFNGRDLQNDSSTLESYNICDNSVLHCLITQRQQNETRQMDNDNGFDIGVFMFPLFGLLLACIWYLRFTYRQLFNTTSTLTLGGITFLFVAAFISTLQRPANHEHID